MPGDGYVQDQATLLLCGSFPRVQAGESFCSFSPAGESGVSPRQLRGGVVPSGGAAPDRIKPRYRGFSQLLPRVDRLSKSCRAPLLLLPCVLSAPLVSRGLVPCASALSVASGRMASLLPWHVPLILGTCGRNTCRLNSAEIAGDFSATDVRNPREIEARIVTSIIISMSYFRSPRPSIADWRRF